MKIRPTWLIALAGLALTVAAATWWAARPRPAPAPAIADSGILTSWPLPPDRGPWQIKWDAIRSRIWFAEGNHSFGLDAVASIDPATNILREWSIPTSGGYVHGLYVDNSGNIW